MKKNGAQILLDILSENGVDTLFGYPGGSVIPLYHELSSQSDKFKHIRTSHEQGAVHAADGYARSTGKLGVCIVTSGPGVTNTITGIATAYMDSAPILVISGQVPTVLLGKDSFQEVDITGISLSITKYSCLIKEIKDFEKSVRKAIKVAMSGRPGPVLIDIPKDIFSKTIEYPLVDEKPYQANSPKFDDDKVAEACELINQSSKPIVYAGGGVRISKAHEALRKFCISKNIPIVNTLMSLGTFPRNHALSLGMVGMHGYPEANMAITNSDMIIAIGARFSDRVIGNPKDFAKNAKVVHIDFDLTEFSKNIDSDVDICGDLKGVLEALTRGVDNKDHTAWLDEIDQYKINPDPSNYPSMKPQEILTAVHESIGENTVICTDVGQHQMWTAQHYPFSDFRQLVTSGGLGTMGFGLGATIGSKIGNPDKHVVLFTGDGCFRMSAVELATITDYNLPVLIVLFNNQNLGMVRQWQKLFQDEVYAETVIPQNIDYCKVAEAYGIQSRKGTDAESIKAAVEEFKTSNKSMFIDCWIDKDIDVYPIVAPGQAIDKYIIKA